MAAKKVIDEKRVALVKEAEALGITIGKGWPTSALEALVESASAKKQVESQLLKAEAEAEATKKAKAKGLLSLADSPEIAENFLTGKSGLKFQLLIHSLVKDSEISEQVQDFNSNWFKFALKAFYAFGVFEPSFDKIVGESKLFNKPKKVKKS